MRRLVVVVLTVLAVVVSTGGSASAQTKVRQDRAGDASRAADVRSLRVANGADRLVVTVRLQRVVTGRSAVLVGVARRLEGAAAGTTVLVDVFPVSGGRYRIRALSQRFSADGEPTSTRLRCAERGVDVRRGRGGVVRIAIDRACVPQLSNRLETAAIGYDKRRLGFTFTELAQAGRALRRGDELDPLVPIEASIDETSFVTTRRG